MHLHTFDEYRNETIWNTVTVPNSIINPLKKAVRPEWIDYTKKIVLNHFLKTNKERE